MDSTSCCPFPIPRRIISTHDSSSGEAIFSAKFDQTPPVGIIPAGPGKQPGRNIQNYSTSTFPVRGLSPAKNDGGENEDADLDLQAYAHDLEHPTLTGSDPSMTICRTIDFPPGGQADMHRTATFDYGIIIDGIVEWVLDSGEKRILQKGDVVIQRATAHAWKNVTPQENNDGWLRMFFIMLPIQKVRVRDGEILEPGYGLPFKDVAEK